MIDKTEVNTAFTILEKKMDTIIATLERLLEVHNEDVEEIIEKLENLNSPGSGYQIE
jgi:endonuclease III